MFEIYDLGTFLAIDFIRDFLGYPKQWEAFVLLFFVL